MEGEHVVLPADVFRGEEELPGIRLLTHLEAVKRRHVTFDLQSCRDASLDIVHLEVAVASELVFRVGHSEACVIEVADAVAFQAGRELSGLAPCILAIDNHTGLSSGQSPDHQTGKDKQ